MRLSTLATLFTAVFAAITIAGTFESLAYDEKCNSDCEVGVSRDSNAIIRIGYPGPGAILDPHRQTQAGEGTYTSLVFDRLTRLSREHQPIPMLATSWQFAEDGAFLEMKLRSDVQFHDGTRFDAAAVKANIERGKTIERSTVARYLSAISSVDIVDEFTVRFRLMPHLGADLPYVLATNAGAMISPKAFADPNRNLTLDPADAGSGPYVVKQFKPNELAVYERAATPSWDKGAGSVRRIEISFAPPDQRLRAFQTGSLDVAQLAGPISRAADTYARSMSASVNEQIIGGGTQVSLLLRAESPAVSDARVRRAIAMGIDRKTVAQVISDGFCRPADQHFEPGDPTHLAGYVDHPFDPAAAKALLSEAGGVGKKIEILAGSGGYWDQAALAIQSMLRDIGLEVEVLAIPVGESVAQFRSHRGDGLVYSMAEPIDPAIFFSETVTGGYALAPEKDRAHLDELLNRTQDPNLAQQAVRKATEDAIRSVADLAVILPICWVDAVVLSRSAVKNRESMVLSVASVRDFRFLTVDAK